MASAESAMTPAQAVQVLRDVDGYEESITVRANGLTGMVWGIVAAAIFLAYGTADPYLENQGLSWIYTLLWAPFVAAGIATTGAIWNAHAITLRRDTDTRKGLLLSVGYTVLFFLICAGIFGLFDALLGVEWSISSFLAMANGVFAVAIGVFMRRGCNPVPSITAGIIMVAAGLVIGATAIHFQAATLIAALAVGLSWFLSGTYLFVRG